MKAKKTLYTILMLLPLVVTLLSLQFLPDLIPAHYGMNNQVDRWGSKYELLIFPAMIIGFGVIILLVAKYAEKQEKNGTNNAKICLITGICTILLFNVLCYYFLYTSFIKAENLDEIVIDLNSLVFAVLGLVLIVMGNVMPKAKMNSMLGLRTAWSMSSEEAWRKSQRFGGIALMLSGAAMVVASLLTGGMLCLWLCLGILVAAVVVCTVYSYFVAKTA